MPSPAPTIAELWVYPVKGCRGVRVESAALTPSGLELDRYWCVVDLEGNAVAKLEAISKRKLPALATVAVSLPEDGTSVELSAPGMEPLLLPIASSSYEGMPSAAVQCSGGSTTQGNAAWRLGEIDSWQHPAGSEWISRYLNRASGNGDRLVSGKKATRYGLMRSKESLSMESYPPILPIIAKANADKDPQYTIRLKDNQRRFADIAPMLLVNNASAQFVASRGGALPGEEAYPIGSFRGNVVVSGAPAWAEETWARLEVGSVTLRKIKECARCTVPCRVEESGEFLFPDDKLKLWKILTKAFPRKSTDPEWGDWAGPLFGVYFGHAAQEGKLKVGDPIVVLETVAWDAHLRRWGSPLSRALLLAGTVALCALVVPLARGRRSA